MNTTKSKAAGRCGRKLSTRLSRWACALAAGSVLLRAQVTAPDTATTPTDDDQSIVVLSPFTVDATEDRGYQASTTLAGTRIRTNLADIGSAISVLTKEMITDIGGYNNETVLAYAVNTEVAGPRGNFSGANRSGPEGHISELASFPNPNGNTRVRGLVAADNTRDCAGCRASRAADRDRRFVGERRGGAEGEDGRRSQE